jgi:hypothetical protein
MTLGGIVVIGSAICGFAGFFAFEVKALVEFVPTRVP